LTLAPLSLAPLIGVTDSLIKAIGFLMVLGAVGGLHFMLMKGLSSLLPQRLRGLAGAIVAATLVSIASLLLQAQSLELYRTLGIYLPIIGVQCLLIQDVGNDQHDNTKGLIQPVGYYSAAFLLLGLVRELLGHGTLLGDAHWLFGANATKWQIDLMPSASLPHLTLLAPGGFILLGLLMAGAKALRQRTQNTRI
jgi:electron transport complex protein RnfE